MSGLLFNKIAAGVLVVALVGASGAELWRRMSGAGASHAASPASEPHGAEQASALAAAPAPGPASASGASPGEAAPATPEGAPGEDTAPAASAPGAGAAEQEAPVAEAAPVAPAGPDYAALFAAANIEEGKTLSVKCAMCHDFSDARKTLVGPPLYDLFGRKVASMPGVNYSQGPGSLSGVAGEWDAARLDSFLENPKKFAPGTFMALPGMNCESERIDLMAYIRSLTAGEPAPLQ